MVFDGFKISILDLDHSIYITGYVACLQATLCNIVYGSYLKFSNALSPVHQKCLTVTIRSEKSATRRRGVFAPSILISPKDAILNCRRGSWRQNSSPSSRLSTRKICFSAFWRNKRQFVSRLLTMVLVRFKKTHH